VKIEDAPHRVQFARHLMTCGCSTAEMANRMGIKKSTAAGYRNKVNRIVGGRGEGFKKVRIVEAKTVDDFMAWIAQPVNQGAKS